MTKDETCKIDYKKAIKAIIRMKLGDALKWLGESATLSTHALFLPPYYDNGYKILIDSIDLLTPSDPIIGSISLIGA